MKNDLKLSVFIATYNRDKIIKETLTEFSNINVDNINWELIIIDNNSTDNTKEVVSSFENKLPIIYLFEKKQGKNCALNTAIEIAKGELFVFTDDDVSPDKNWLKEILSCSERWNKTNIFGGKVEPKFPSDNISKFIIQGNFSSYVFAIFSPYDKEMEFNKGLSPVGPNCWFRRSIFDGGLRYNSDIGPKGNGRISGSELSLFETLIKQGEKIVYSPNAIVQHRIQLHQTKVAYLLKRAYASGRGWVRIKKPIPYGVLICGIPRYYFKEILEKSASFLIRILIRKNYFEPLMEISMICGAMKEYHDSYKMQGTIEKAFH